MPHFQVGILGGGPGGYVCALRAAQLGLSVVLIEGERVGGTCLNRGCIPTKALVKSAELWREMGRAAEFGLAAADLSYDYVQVMQRKDHVVQTLVKGVEQLLKAAKVQVIRGWGEFKELGRLDAHTAAGDVSFTVDNVVIATGSLPSPLAVPGADLAGVFTSEAILNETALPDSLVIVGGGVIGLEFAGIYRSFGVKVTVVEMMSTLLPNLDEEMPKRLLPLLKRQGIEVLTKTGVRSIVAGGTGLIVRVEDAQGLREITTAQVLVATGRRPNLRGIDVETLGLALERRSIKVDTRMQTNLPHVYAVGDVHGGMMLAHVASKEGIVAADNIAGNTLHMDYEAVPNTIFTYPEIATVGKTEQELKAGGISYKVSKFPFSANGKALALGETMGIVKILADAEGVVIGAGIMGPQASSLIQELTLAVGMGLSAEDLAYTIHAHPTLPEAVMEAAHGIMGKPLHLA